MYKRQVEDGDAAKLLTFSEDVARQFADVAPFQRFYVDTLADRHPGYPWLCPTYTVIVLRGSTMAPPFEYAIFANPHPRRRAMALPFGCRRWTGRWPTTLSTESWMGPAAQRLYAAFRGQRLPSSDTSGRRRGSPRAPGVNEPHGRTVREVLLLFGRPSVRPDRYRREDSLRPTMESLCGTLRAERGPAPG